MSLGFDEPFGVATVAFRRTVRVASSEEVRISARKRHRIKGLKSGSSPLVMLPFLELVRPIGEGGEDLDEHMVAAKAEGRRLCGHSRGGALELVGENGAAGRDGGRHRLNENIDAAAVERRKPARLHECALPIDD